MIRLRDLDVITENVVEADLERRDPGALPLARFDLRDVLAAVLAEVAQFVEFRVVTGADGRAVADVDRRRVGQRRDDRARTLRAPDRAARKYRVRRAESGLRRQPRGFGQLRHLIERFAEREQIARPGAADHDLREQPLDIEHRRKLLAQLRAQDGFAHQIAHRIEARFDFRAIERRPQQPLPQQAAAHAGRGLIENADQALRRRSEKIGSTSSRLRTVTASSTMVSARSK